MTAETSKAPPRCTTVGVPKALIESIVVRKRMFAMSVTTTNWIPTRAAPADPTMTKKFPHFPSSAMQFTVHPTLRTA